MLDNIHWLGQSTFYIQFDKVTIYIDPYRIKKDKPKADIILITHTHFDHYSPSDIKIIAKDDTIIVGPKSLKSELSYTLKTLNPKDKINIQGIEIEAVSAYNINKNFHPPQAKNLGFIILVNKMRIYHTGDTDFIPEMKDIKADIVLLPIGGTYTMDAKEAVRAVEAIKPKIAIPMHWGSVVGSYSDAEEFKRLSKTEVKILRQE